MSNDLEKAVDDFINNKIAITDLKLAQKLLAEKILIEMKKEGRDNLTVSHAGEQWSFQVVHNEDELRVAKVTKTPAADDQEELPGTDK